MRVLSPRIEPPDTVGRIDREHRDAVALVDQQQSQRFDEGRFADTGHARDAEAKGLAGAGQQRRQQLVGLRAMVGTGRFEQRDRLGDRAALRHAGRIDDRTFERLHGVQHGASQPATAARICSSTSLALAGMGVPGP